MARLKDPAAQGSGGRARTIQRAKDSGDHFEPQVRDNVGLLSKFDQSHGKFLLFIIRIVFPIYLYDVSTEKLQATFSILQSREYI